MAGFIGTIQGALNTAYNDTIGAVQQGVKDIEEVYGAVVSFLENVGRFVIKVEATAAMVVKTVVVWLPFILMSAFEVGLIVAILIMNYLIKNRKQVISTAIKLAPLLL